MIPSSPVSTRLGHRRACNVVSSISRGNLAVVLRPPTQAPPWSICPHNPIPGIDHSGSSPHYGYASTAPSVPLPDAPAHHIHEEAYPLQAEIEQQHRILRTHIFTEVISPHQTGVNRLMVTEVDCSGVKHNRQPEFLLQWNCWSHSCRPPWLD